MTFDEFDGAISESIGVLDGSVTTDHSEVNGYPCFELESGQGLELWITFGWFERDMWEIQSDAGFGRGDTLDAALHGVASDCTLAEMNQYVCLGRVAAAVGAILVQEMHG